MKKLISLLTVLCILFSLNLFVVPVSALQTVDGFPFIDDESNYLYSYKPSIIPRVLGLENQLFTMSTSSLTQLLTSRNNNKSFYGEIFSDNGDVYYIGTLQTSNGYDARAGICVWNPATSSYSAEHSTDFPSDEFTCSEMIPTTQFRDHICHYGFIDGTDTGGTSGSIQFWYLNYDA